MDGEHKKFNVGDKVILLAVPPALLHGLPEEDQHAITAMVGKHVTFVGYDERGQAELEFPDPLVVQTHEHSYTHTIWVSPEFIERDRA